MTASQSDRAGAFFGRRKGKRLRAGQDELVRDLLPRLRVSPSGDLADLQARYPKLWLEIGFGGGEHLAAQARANPEMGFVGCEPFVNGMAKLLAVVDQERLDNIRLWDEDATDLLPALPEAAFDRVAILYPDPWPKRRQRKRRFISPESLALVARALKLGGLFRFASDIDDYVGWTLARALELPELRWRAEAAPDWLQPFPGWPGTRYERKALAEGRRPSYLTFERVGED